MRQRSFQAVLKFRGWYVEWFSVRANLRHPGERLGGRIREMKKYIAFGIALVAAGQSLTDQYRATADRVIDAALADNDGYGKLTYLCDRIGARLSGSESLERA